MRWPGRHTPLCVANQIKSRQCLARTSAHSLPLPLECSPPAALMSKLILAREETDPCSLHPPWGTRCCWEAAAAAEHWAEPMADTLLHACREARHGHCSALSRPDLPTGLRFLLPLPLPYVPPIPCCRNGPSNTCSKTNNTRLGFTPRHTRLGMDAAYVYRCILLAPPYLLLFASSHGFLIAAASLQSRGSIKPCSLT
jgi:hypothetical protein